MNGLLKCGESLSSGEHSDLVGILQIILNALKIRYDCYDFLELTFTFDEATENAVKCWQRTNLLSQSGVVDEQIWNMMLAEFALIRNIE